MVSDPNRGKSVGSAVYREASNEGSSGPAHIHGVFSKEPIPSYESIVSLFSDNQLRDRERNPAVHVPSLPPSSVIGRSGRRRRRRPYQPPSPKRQAQLDAMWAVYVDGASAEQVGAQQDPPISKQAVIEAFHRHGYELRAGAKRPDLERQLARIEDVLERYDAGTPVAQIAADLGRSRNRIYELIREGGRCPEQDRRAREAAKRVG